MNIDPNQYREDSLGRMVPIDQIKEVDMMRDSLVLDIIAQARCRSECNAKFKRSALDDIDAFVELSAEKYGAKMGGRKGNLTLTSYDGRYKIKRAVQESLVFDERLKAAKHLIDELLTEWTENARPEIRTIIQDAFRVDKEGHISTTKVLGLRRLGFDDPKWIRAMEAISDSVQVAVSKTHLRFYERDDRGEYIHMPLDPQTV